MRKLAFVLILISSFCYASSLDSLFSIHNFAGVDSLVRIYDNTPFKTTRMNQIIAEYCLFIQNTEDVFNSDDNLYHPKLSISEYISYPDSFTFVLGKKEYLEKDYVNALDFFDQYQTKFGGSSELYLWIGLTYLQLNSFDLAIIKGFNNVDPSDEIPYIYANSLKGYCYLLKYQTKNNFIPAYISHETNLQISSVGINEAYAIFNETFGEILSNNIPIQEWFLINKTICSTELQKYDMIYGELMFHNPISFSDSLTLDRICQFEFLHDGKINDECYDMGKGIDMSFHSRQQNIKFPFFFDVMYNYIIKSKDYYSEQSIRNLEFFLLAEFDFSQKKYDNAQDWIDHVDFDTTSNPELMTRHFFIWFYLLERSK